MTKQELKKLRLAMDRYTTLANIKDKKAIDEMYEKLSKMDIDDALDRIIVSIDRLHSKGQISEKDILKNASFITNIAPDKYSDVKGLMDRLHFLKEMNIEYPEMPLKENHKLVLETFDKFNKLIGTKFDAYYTGGLMGYIATGHELERYHGDLDLFINENQLNDLYEVVKKSKDFKFVSNLDEKEETGHEFKITYKDTPMNIGLFLFDRTKDKEMVLKEYYYKDKNPQNGLQVNEHYLSEKYSKEIFSDEVQIHNGIPYKMQSLEGIYNAKKDGRPKDKYDAKIIEPYINKEKEQKLDSLKKENYDMNHERPIGSPVPKMDEKVKEEQAKESIQQSNENNEQTYERVRDKKE